MAGAETIASRALETLVTAGLITSEQLASVKDSAESSGAALGAVLAERGLVAVSDVEAMLEDEIGIPRVDLSSYAPDDGALFSVPAQLAKAWRILPLFEIDGTLTVAVGDAMDVFSLDELGATLGLEIEPVLADVASVVEAVAQYYGVAVPEAAPATPAAPAPRVVPVFVEDETPTVLAPSEEVVAQVAGASIEEVVATALPAGPSAIDLDVLAVADSRKVAVLVADILEYAVANGATRIHLLPYKEEFFLVNRVQGKLEKVAHAPLSMQGPLVEGFKNFAHLAGVPANLPALGRVHAQFGDRDLVVTVSAVPTVSGQRVVVSLAPFRSQPRGLAELGMSDSEEKALHAMVERGRGLLLVCGPVAGGRSATYYALLAHAASSGKTVYSVERSVEYELPAVAQVLVNPGSPVAASQYFAAGIRQDTDVIAIDSIQSVEDVHLAVEAAGMGKLVVATFAAGDIAAGVRRMLDLGAEPTSLAAALTLAVGQRLVRLTCPNCAEEKHSDVAARIPGAPAGLTSKIGAGCPNCGKTGFRGATGIFEVLPFSEAVRARVAKSESGEALAQAARTAGMRGLAVSGLAKVTAGLVSAEELDRVLRFSD
ncbi:MAG: ATPase, T2SS/T4P/T4SS family [Coriobacteriia bacterium]